MWDANADRIRSQIATNRAVLMRQRTTPRLKAAENVERAQEQRAQNGE
jgi:hypothetical protein